MPTAVSSAGTAGNLSATPPAPNVISTRGMDFRLAMRQSANTGRPVPTGRDIPRQKPPTMPRKPGRSGQPKDSAPSRPAASSDLSPNQPAVPPDQPQPSPAGPSASNQPAAVMTQQSLRLAETYESPGRSPDALPEDAAPPSPAPGAVIALPAQDTALFAGRLPAGAPPADAAGDESAADSSSPPLAASSSNPTAIDSLAPQSMAEADDELTAPRQGSRPAVAAADAPVAETSPPPAPATPQLPGPILAESPPPAAAEAGRHIADDSFARVNHPRIITAVRAELLSRGGTMQIRLEPPELGAMQIRVELRDGVLSASFQTSNDTATRLLSHSLGDLKAALESHGLSVHKLHVQQAPPQDFRGEGDQGAPPQGQDQPAHQHEQQRREMLRRMWQRLWQGRQPLDLVA